ncbi:methyltransferase family protein [Bacteroidota bacterium]
MNKYIILAVLYIIFCFFHSFLISIPVTRYFKKKLGKYYCTYRLNYNIFSLITLFPIIYYEYAVNDVTIFSWSGLWNYFRYLIIVLGMLLLYAGGKGYSFKQFVGITQIKNNCRDENDVASEKLSTTGILKYVRHPWYTAVIILLWSRNLDYTNLIANTILTIYIVIGTYLEEYKMIKAFGNEYIEYKKRVSMFIPLKWVFK